MTYQRSVCARTFASSSNALSMFTPLEILFFFYYDLVSPIFYSPLAPMRQKENVSTTLMTLLRFFFLPILPSSWKTLMMALQVDILIFSSVETSLIFSPFLVIRSIMRNLTYSGIFLYLLLLFFPSIPCLFVFICIYVFVFDMYQCISNQYTIYQIPYHPLIIYSQQMADTTNNQSSLISALQEQPSFLVETYNKRNTTATRSGGVYIPPHKLRALQEEMLSTDPNSISHQRLMWDLLRKSINGIVNKVNIANIQNIVIELFNENILRGKGLLGRSIIKAQMASPNFTHVYAALVAIINCKLPEIGNLIIKRVLIQFRRSYERNNRIVCMATTKMLAHLINQKVLGEYIGLQMLEMFLSHPTEDSVQIACDFMIEVGQFLAEVSPAGSNAIFQGFKSILHQAQVDQKAQYSIQNLFAIRKTHFKDHPGVLPQLDLVQPQDCIIHQFDLAQQLDGQENLNVFKADPNYLKTEQEWQSIKQQILGEDNIINLKQMPNYQDQVDQQPQPQQKIKDLTEQDLINLRKTIYLAIQSTVNFQECAHKILKMNIAKGYESELIDMILECCMMERIYQKFFGLLAQRFCLIDENYKELFLRAFINHYNNIFKLQANKIRNLAKLYGHLFYRFAIDWKVMQIITMKADMTTAAGRIFLKFLFREIAENMGIDKMAEYMQSEEIKEYVGGLFPIDHPNNLRFAINYYTSIGLGKLTEPMREVLEMQQQIIMQRKEREEQLKMQMLMQQQQEMMRQMEEQQRQFQKQQQKRKEQQKEKERKKEKEKEREKQRERERERQKQKTKERERQRQRQRERERSREKQRNRQKERQTQKQRQREKQRQKAKQRQRKDRQIQKQKERGRQRERQRERERQRGRGRQKERTVDNANIKKEEKQQVNQKSSVDQQYKSRKRTQKPAYVVSSSSSSSSSQSSSSSKKPSARKRSPIKQSKKERLRQKINDKRKKNERSRSNESQSSGVQFSSNQSGGRRDQSQNRSSSSSSSSSGSSSKSQSSDYGNQTKKRDAMRRRLT